MPKNRTLLALTLFASVAMFDAHAGAQDVVFSEIGGAGPGAWIELHNRGAAAADLTTWCLNLVTATPMRAQTYWWGFPAGTVVPAGGYLVVRWYAPVPAVPVPGELATGTSAAGFLFGLGAEPLPATSGGIGLLDSRDVAVMGSPSIFVDWVTWGAGGSLRESLAIQAGRWVPGRATVPLAPAGSIARNLNWPDPTTPDLAWFVDGSPTPGAPNAGAAAVASIGQGCAPLGHHLLGTPALTWASQPVIGNAAFRIRVTNTTGVLLERCVVAVTAGAVPAGIAGLLPPAPGADACRVFVDPSTWVFNYWLRTGLTATEVPLSIANVPASLAGLEFSLQAIVYDETFSAWPAWEGVTNALTVTLGN